VRYRVRAADLSIDLDECPAQLLILTKRGHFAFGFTLFGGRGKAFGNRLAVAL
jgi:hypothetical protein